MLEEQFSMDDDPLTYKKMRDRTRIQCCRVFEKTEFDEVVQFLLDWKLLLNIFKKKKTDVFFFETCERYLLKCNKLSIKIHCNLHYI